MNGKRESREYVQSAWLDNDGDDDDDENEDDDEEEITNHD